MNVCAHNRAGHGNLSFFHKISHFLSNSRLFYHLSIVSGIIFHYNLVMSRTLVEIFKRTLDSILYIYIHSGMWSKSRDSMFEIPRKMYNWPNIKTIILWKQTEQCSWQNVKVKNFLFVKETYTIALDGMIFTMDFFLRTFIAEMKAGGDAIVLLKENVKIQIDSFNVQRTQGYFDIRNLTKVSLLPPSAKIHVIE